MGFAVKITTFSKILDLLCPPVCLGCGKIGEPLCKCCKNYSIFRNSNFCPSCLEEIDRVCPECDLPFSATFVGGLRSELLGEMVEEYKFRATRDYSRTLAEILGAKIPTLLGDIVVVPLPTVAKHIRARGFDHTLRLARDLASLREWEVLPILERAKNTVQVGANRQNRWKQALNAYRINQKIPVKKGKTYLLLDDVWTTGASMLSAAEVMRKAGAENLMAAVLVVNGHRKGEETEENR